MKTRTSVYAKILRVSSYVGLTVAFLIAFVQLSVFAQAGRVIPQPASRPTPTPQTASPNQATPQTVVIDRNADRYKVVLPTSPDLDSFAKQLNKAGEQRYKLISVVYRWQPKPASAKYDYFVPVA